MYACRFFSLDQLVVVTRRTALTMMFSAVTACGSGGLGAGEAGAPTSIDAGVPPSSVCRSGPVTATETHSVDSIGENVDTTCASVAGKLAWKGGPPGSSCTDPIDCAPVCCACPTSAYHTFATWCDHGRCAAPESVCCMVLGTALGASCGQ
jgi:hypothetical protein